jgi:hypothetical protein
MTSTFDIWKISQDDNTMYLLQLRGADGFVAHAVTVWKGMIFYSNLKICGTIDSIKSRILCRCCISWYFLWFSFCSQDNHFQKYFQEKNKAQKKTYKQKINACES